MPKFASPFIAALASLACLAIAPEQASIAAGPLNPFDNAVPLVRPGDRMPATAFVNQDGRPRTFAALRGAAVAAAFVYTKCTDACPIITQKFSQADALLRGGPYRLIEVTIDPERDVVPVIGAYARRHGMWSPGWELWTSSPPAIADFENRMGVQSIRSGDDVIHNERLIIIDPAGTVTDMIDGSSWTPADLAAQLKHVAGNNASLLDRIDLALGKAAAYCSSAIAGRSGIADLIASVAVFAAAFAVFVWLVRRFSAA